MMAIRNYMKLSNIYSIQRKNLTNMFQINYDYLNIINKFNQFNINNDQNNQVIELKNKTSKILARKKAKRKYKKKVSLRWR